METWQVILLSVTVTVVLSLLGFAIKGALWAGEVNSDTTWLKEAIQEIRQDVKEIFKRLGGPTIESSSPIKLTDKLTELGKRVADEIDGQTWAQNEAPKIKVRVRGQSDYEIQEFCMDYCVAKYQPTAELLKKMQISAYNNGIGLRSVQEVLGVLLRDEIIQSVSR